MTNYNERLDEILALLNARMPQPKTMNEATTRVAMLQETKQALLAWHNKQTLELLDRLEKAYDWSYDVGEYITLSAIEAEREKLNKLKETK